MKPVVYFMEPSPPCRAVWMTARAANIDIELKRLDLLKNEQLADWFIKINPFHEVPTLDDDGFYLWESRAVMCYLVDKYAKDDSLYPKDLKKRALVDQALNYDQGTLYKAIVNWLYPQLFEKLPPSNEREQEMKIVLDMLNKNYLDSNPYLAGDHLTIVDISVACQLTFLQDMKNYDLQPWPKVYAWVQQYRNLPYYTECSVGHKELKERLPSWTRSTVPPANV